MAITRKLRSFTLPVPIIHMMDECKMLNRSKGLDTNWSKIAAQAFEDYCKQHGFNRGCEDCKCSPGFEMELYDWL